MVSWQFTGSFCNVDRISQELRKEAQMCILQHPNIVELHAVISEPGHYGIVMEFVLNGALDDYLLDNNVRCSVSGVYIIVYIYLSFVIEQYLCQLVLG